MSNHFNSNDDAQLDQQLNQQLDQLLVRARQAQSHSPASPSDVLLKANILAALPITAAPTDAASANLWLDHWLDKTWQWFAQPYRLMAAAALPLLLGFMLGNATLITDNELLVALSEQDGWSVEQMIDDTQWSNGDE